MANSTASTKTPKANNDGSVSGLNQSLPPIPSQPRVKEQEPGAAFVAEEAKIMKEIISTSEKVDSQSLEKVREQIGEEVRSGEPEPQLPADVEDAGVISPLKEAGDVVERGSTLELPISEQAFKHGQKIRLSAKVDRVTRNVIGPASIIALAAWVGRILKMAHKHTMKVIFRKEN